MNEHKSRMLCHLIRVGFVVFLAIVTGCASNPQQNGEVNPDKFEKMNRAVFTFNDTLDRWIMKPVAKGYDWVTPDPIQTGIGNFFDNIGEVPNVINDGLQWKWKRAAHDTGRFLINSTVGVLGFFDVASKAGLEKSDGESFTQTLHTWGVPRGPYIVVPFLGPSTVRGVASIPADFATDPIRFVNPTEVRYGMYALDLLHTRAELLETEELISGDRYLFIREVYLQRLEYLENDGEVEDDFGDDFDDEDFDDEEDF